MSIFGLIEKVIPKGLSPSLVVLIRSVKTLIQPCIQGSSTERTPLGDGQGSRSLDQFLLAVLINVVDLI